MSEPRDIKDIFSHEDFESQTVWAPHSRSLAYIANKKANPIYQRLLDANKKLRDEVDKIIRNPRYSSQIAVAAWEAILSEASKSEGGLDG